MSLGPMERESLGECSQDQDDMQGYFPIPSTVQKSDLRSRRRLTIVQAYLLIG